MASDDDKLYLTPGEAARLLMVSPITLRGWAQRGLLPFEITVGGHRRFLRESVEQFAKKRKSASWRNSLRILVVDDDPQLAEFLVEWLSSVDDSLVVNAAADGFEAGRKVHILEPDIVLLDLMMPKLDGFAVCRQIKADPSTCDIRVIAMTGYSSPENEQRIIEAGAETCLPKPLDLSLLLELLIERRCQK